MPSTSSRPDDDAPPGAVRDRAGVMGFLELTLRARDIDALARFYIDGFGLRELAREEDRIWLGVGHTARLGLWTPGVKEFGDEGGAHVHYAIAVRHGTLDELAARLRAQGHDVRGPVEHDGGDRSLYVRDPEGNVVEAWDLLDRPDAGREGVAVLDENRS